MILIVLTSISFDFKRYIINLEQIEKFEDTKEVTGTHKRPMKIPKRSPEHTSGQKRKNTKGQTMIYKTLQRKR